MSAKLCIDLCSGLGGFSQAFLDAGWEVITVDIEPKFKPTICADVLTLKASDIESQTSLKDFRRYDKIVAVMSPPCNHFSPAGLVAGWPRKGIRESLDIVGACLEIVADIRISCKANQAWWLMENPNGMLKRFLPFKPASTIRYSDFDSPFKKPTNLWGNIRLPMVFAVGSWIKAPRQKHSARINSHGIIGDLKRPEERAKVPYGLSKAILETVDAAPT